VAVGGLVREADVSRTNVPDASASLKLKPQNSKRGPTLQLKAGNKNRVDGVS